MKVGQFLLRGRQHEERRKYNMWNMRRTALGVLIDKDSLSFLYNLSPSHIRYLSTLTVCARHTDRQTDRQTEKPTLWRICIHTAVTQANSE